MVSSHKRKPLANKSNVNNSTTQSFNRGGNNTTTTTMKKPQQQQNGRVQSHIVVQRIDDDDDDEEEGEDRDDDVDVIGETQRHDDVDEDQEAEEEEENVDGMEVDQQQQQAPKRRTKSTTTTTTTGKSSTKRGGGEGNERVDDDEHEDDQGRLSSRERRMLTRLELTQKKLKEMTEAFNQLSELRTTKAEESEAALTQLASERQAAAMTMIDNYKHENDSLRNELSGLRAKRAAGINVTDGERIEELLLVIEAHGEEKQALQARISELEEFAAASQIEERRRLQERDHKWQKELERTVKAKNDEANRLNAELQQELQQAQQELDAEIEHSKTLQARMTAVAVASSTNKNNLGAASNSSSATEGLKLARALDELSMIKKHLNLSEDLTGFSVVAVKYEDGCSVYSAILNDYLGRTGGLTFKLTFYDDGTCGYKPDVEPERDAVLVDLLPKQLQGYMRFDAEKCSEWFRNLWFSVNKLKA